MHLIRKKVSAGMCILSDVKESKKTKTDKKPAFVSSVVH